MNRLGDRSIGLQIVSDDDGTNVLQQRMEMTWQWSGRQAVELRWAAAAVVSDSEVTCQLRSQRQHRRAGNSCACCRTPPKPARTQHYSARTS